MVNKITTPPTQNEVIDKINELVDGKQDTLVSGTNIKTVGGTSLVGSGNVDFPTVDQTYSASSTNAQSGVAVANAIAPKQDTLVSGTNIKTINGNSLLGSGNIEIQSQGVVDADLSQTSENPVQNKVITAAISDLYSQVNIDTYLDLIIAGNTQDLPIVTQGTYETDLTNIIGGTYVNV